jgi:hypothetical protein
MQNVSLKKKTQKMAAQKERAHRKSLQSHDGIPEFMIRLAREQHVKISEQIAMPKYRHD